MSSIMGEVILHSTLEEYQEKMKSNPKPKPTGSNKPTANTNSDNHKLSDNVVGKIADPTPLMITTTQTTLMTTSNPDNDLPTVDYKDIGAYGPYGAYGDSNDNYGAYGSYETYDTEDIEPVEPVDLEDIQEVEVEIEDEEIKEADEDGGEAVYEESLDADLPTFDYGDLGDIYGDYGSLASYGSYRRKRRSPKTSDSRSSRIQQCLDDYWDRGDERCICSMIPADFYFNAEYMECRFDQETDNEILVWSKVEGQKWKVKSGRSKAMNAKNKRPKRLKVDSWRKWTVPLNWTHFMDRPLPIVWTLYSNK